MYVKKIVITIILLVSLFITGCNNSNNKQLSEDEIKNIILTELENQYQEKFVINKFIEAGGEDQSCFVSQCGYRAWVVSRNDGTNSFVVWIDRDGTNFNIEDDIETQTMTYLKNKYNEEFEIIKIQYGYCSEKVSTDWKSECQYTIEVYSKINSKNFEVLYLNGLLEDNYKS